MMTMHGKIGDFDPGQESWDTYVERLQLYFVANKIEEVERKRAVLLTAAGPSLYRLVRNLAAPAKPAEKSFDELVELVKAHYAPKPSVTMQRFKFHSRAQQPGESVAAFLAELRQLSEFCEFGSTLEDMLRDRLVCGIAVGSIQRRLLAEPELTLKKAVDFARAMETADKDVKDLQGRRQAPNGAAVHATSVDRNRRAFRPPDRTLPGTQETNQCHRCGGKHPPRDCRFKTAVCNACKKRGHLARVCRTKGAHPGKDKGTRSQQTHALENTEEDPYDGQDPYTLFALDGQRVQPITATLKVNGAEMVMEVDTGAAVSVISEETFKSVWPESPPVVEPTRIKLRTYSGHSLQILGNITVLVEYQGQQESLPLLVVKGSGATLLGRNWLNKIRLDWQNIGRLDDRLTLQRILQKYSDVFRDELGAIKGVTAKIEVDQDVQPRFCRARPVPFALRPKVEAELKRLEELGIIEPVTTAEWAAPIVPVAKSDGSVRICGDYRLTINQASRLDAYPLPKVEELLATLAGGKKFSKLDLQNAYLQLSLEDSSKKYTTITTQKGLFQYSRLPFGVSSAPAIFQRAMDSLIQGVPHTVAYMDDLLVTGESEESHLQNLEAVLSRLQTAGVRLKKPKCVFMATEVEYLGHRITSEGLHPAPDKIKAISEAPKPQNVSQLKSFLGLVSYYSKFLPSMATTLAPLYSLLQKNKRWQWGQEQQCAFETAKSRLQSDSLLVHFDTNKEVTLACDASPYGLGAVISHRTEDGAERPIAFASRTLAPAEKNYSQLEKEALAIVYGVKKFHNYLCGRHFFIHSDHQPLRHLFDASKGVPPVAAARILRWSLTLSAYEYTILYRPGKELGHADALSRLPLPQVPTSVPVPGDLRLVTEHLDALSLVSSREIKSWTDKDPDLSRVRRFLLQGWPARVPDSIQPYLRRREELSVLDGCVLWGARVVVPPPGRQQILDELHETHPGIAKMKSLSRSYVWWPNICADLEAKVKACEECQSSRPTPPVAPLHPWEWPQRPWLRLHLDYAGPFLGRMFLILVDAHSKWIEAFPVQSATSAQTIEKLRNVFATHGLPERVVTDNGAVFTSDEFRTFLTNNGIAHTRTAPYHPSSNGLAERAVQTFKQGIKRVQGGTIETRLARFLSKYRIIPHATTGRSPAELLLGRQPRTRLDLLHPDIGGTVKARQAQQKRVHDVHSRARAFQAGDRVYVQNFGGGPTWLEGTILDQTGPISFRVLLGDGRVWKRHVDHMRIRYPQDSPTPSLSEEFDGPFVPTAEPNPPARQPGGQTGPPGQDPSQLPGPRRSTRDRRPPERLC